MSIGGSGKSVYVGVLFGVTAASIWGGFPVVTKFGIEQTLSAYDIAAIRFLVAGIALAPMLITKGFFGVSRFNILIISVGAGVPYMVAVSTALVITPVAHFGLITPCSMMIFSAIGGKLFLNSDFSKSRLLGMVVVSAGLMLVAWEGLYSFSDGVLLGDFLLMLGGFLWASYTVASKKCNLDAVHACAIVSVFSMLVYLPIYAIFMESNISRAPIEEVVFQAVFQGLLSAVIALIAYTKAVNILGAERASVFGAIVPTFVILFSYLFLNEIPTNLQLLGAVIVSVGMLLAIGLVRFSVREGVEGRT